MLLATKPGQPPCKLEKRTNDSLYVEIDCSPLLPDKQGFFGNVEVVMPASTPLTITKSVAKQLKLLSFTVSGGPVQTQQAEYLVHFKLKCTDTSVVSVPVLIKCYLV